MSRARALIPGSLHLQGSQLRPPGPGNGRLACWSRLAQGLSSPYSRAVTLDPGGRPGGGFSRGHSGQPAGSALPTPRPVQMFVQAGRPEILERLDPSPKCSVTCQACQPVPGHLAPVDLGPTGCKRALVGGLPQPLPCRGCQRGRALAVFRSLLSFTGFLTFCYRIHSVAGWWQWGWAL